jgi:putative transposase
VKRYGRVDQTVRTDIIETVNRYKGYGFTQEQICLKIGISVSYFHRIKKYPDKVSDNNKPRIGYNINAILLEEENAIVEYAKANPNYMHRELTWRLVDEKITYVGMTTVYRILSKNRLILANKMRVKYGWVHKYSNEAKSPDERWQTDITYLQYKGRDVYQLSFIDVYSRFIVFSVTLLNMESQTVSDAFNGYLEIHKHELKRFPIIQSDNGSPYIGHEFKKVMNEYVIEHVRCHPATPTENVIIERWHRTLKEGLAEHEYPKDFEEFKELIQNTIHYYNYERYHKSLGYVTPFEYYRGNPEEIFTERKKYCKIVRKNRRLINSERVNTLSIETS